MTMQLRSLLFLTFTGFYPLGTVCAYGSQHTHPLSWTQGIPMGTNPHENPLNVIEPLPIRSLTHWVNFPLIALLEDSQYHKALDYVKQSEKEKEGLFAKLMEKSTDYWQIIQEKTSSQEKTKAAFDAFLTAQSNYVNHERNQHLCIYHLATPAQKTTYAIHRQRWQAYEALLKPTDSNVIFPLEFESRPLVITVFDEKQYEAGKSLIEHSHPSAREWQIKIKNSEMTYEAMHANKAITTSQVEKAYKTLRAAQRELMLLGWRLDHALLNLRTDAQEIAYRKSFDQVAGYLFSIKFPSEDLRMGQRSNPIPLEEALMSLQWDESQWTTVLALGEQCKAQLPPLYESAHQALMAFQDAYHFGAAEEDLILFYDALTQAEWAIRSVERTFALNLYQTLTETQKSALKVAKSRIKSHQHHLQGICPPEEGGERELNALVMNDRQWALAQQAFIKHLPSIQQATHHEKSLLKDYDAIYFSLDASQEAMNQQVKRTMEAKHRSALNKQILFHSLDALLTAEQNTTLEAYRQCIERYRSLLTRSLWPKKNSTR